MRTLRSAASVLLLATAVPAAVAAQGTAIVQGRIFDEFSASGVPAAIVELRGRGTRVTAEDGVFRFDRVRPGSYTLSISALGYATETRVIDVQSSLTLSIRLERAPLALAPIAPGLVQVAGRVRDVANDFFLVDAEVFTNRGRIDATDPRGRFRLSGLL